MIPSWIYKSVVAKVETNVMEARVFFFCFFGGGGEGGALGLLLRCDL